MLCFYELDRLLLPIAGGFVSKPFFYVRCKLDHFVLKPDLFSLIPPLRLEDKFGGKYLITANRFTVSECPFSEVPLWCDSSSTCYSKDNIENLQRIMQDCSRLVRECILATTITIGEGILDHEVESGSLSPQL